MIDATVFVIAGKYVIRFTVTSTRTTLDDITRDWAEIKTTATEIIYESSDITGAARQRVPLGGMYNNTQVWFKRVE